MSKKGFADFSCLTDPNSTVNKLFGSTIKFSRRLTFPVICNHHRTTILSNANVLTTKQQIHWTRNTSFLYAFKPYVTVLLPFKMYTLLHLQVHLKARVILKGNMKVMPPDTYIILTKTEKSIFSSYRSTSKVYGL